MISTCIKKTFALVDKELSEWSRSTYQQADAVDVWTFFQYQRPLKSTFAPVNQTIVTFIPATLYNHF